MDVGNVIARLGAAAQNALEVARFGGLDTGDEPSPFVVAAEDRVYKLRHYFPAEADQEAGSPSPPVLLIPPMMLSADVYDVAPAASAVATLREQGVDPWVIDFGAPEREEGGLERDLTDHILAVSEAVDRVREATGRDVHLSGYSQGGMFAYQAAAYRRSEGIDSLITFGSPVDTRGAFGVPEQLAVMGASLLAGPVGRIGLPAWASRTGFRLLDPVKSVRSQLEFLMQLHDREALLPRERQRRFLEGEGWVAWSGPAIAELLRQFVLHNRLVSGGFVIEDRLLTLADVTCPVLYFVGEVDEIAPPDLVRAIVRAAPRAEVHEVALRAGHFGLVVGRTATQTSWPVVSAWAKWRAGEGELPEQVRRVEEAEESTPAAGVAARLGYGFELATETGFRVAESVAGTASRTARSVRELTREAATQLPRLVRLEQIQPHTRISLGLLLDEQARRRGDDVLFLWEDRAHSHDAVGRRIDNVVRGLISLGVRQGEHVGVLMGTRPTALVTVAALSRLGAVAVLLRPGGELAREMELGQVDRVITDPDHAEQVRGKVPVHPFVLGGGGDPRDLGSGLVDMERIDPDEVPLPAWYRPNPGLARDLAFILFTGEGERTRVSRITNRRWALSAFGTASSAALSTADTVYGVTPVFHPSGLLMSLGGAVAGGARIAMARSFDPDTFWDEVRRYGITVASYTWTLLHDVAEAPPNRNERHHPVRLFIGSGMPTPLWRRVTERFAPARVLEFYASTEGEAILVNLTGTKPGSLGRSLPGSAEVRIARYDTGADRLMEGPDGFAIPCETGEPGVLLARASPEAMTSATPLRGVFSRGDAWLPTNDYFVRDEDGDHWLLDHIPALIHTPNGVAAAGPVNHRLGTIDVVGLAVTYGVGDVVVSAVRLRDGHELRGEDLDAALADLQPHERPSFVREVDEIPVTTWYRPAPAKLREEGLPGDDDQRVWRRTEGGYAR